MYVWFYIGWLWCRVFGMAGLFYDIIGLRFVVILIVVMDMLFVVMFEFFGMFEVSCFLLVSIDGQWVFVYLFNVEGWLVVEVWFDKG